jgi:hypothetical protein
MWGIRQQHVPAEARQEDAVFERIFMRSLEAEMLSNLPANWESVFLESWATEEMIKLGLGSMKPPKNPESAQREPSQ